jgi:hypothetical protein
MSKADLDSARAQSPQLQKLPEHIDEANGRTVLMLTFRLEGQLPSGKNQVRKTRKGQHYPNKRFELWREEAYYQIVQQIGGQRRALGLPLSTTPLTLRVQYVPGDLRTRDVTGMGDALFHLFTYAKLIVNDGQIRNVHWTELPLNRKAPEAFVSIEAA